MNKTKIDWADHTWNPVTGCRYECSYCYARTISKRFSGDVRLNKSKIDRYTLSQDRNLYILEEPFLTRENRALNYPFGFEPTLHRYRMDALQKLKQSKNIFVGSMTDLFGEWVPDEWIEEVFKASEKSPQHNYLFLTKNPKRYVELIEKKILRTGKNYWYGTTIIAPEDIFFSHDELNIFVSIEPILHPWLSSSSITKKVDWIIAGAETGNRRDKVIPKKEWITALVEQGKESGIPILLKNSLTELMGKEFIQEFPDGLKKLDKVPKNTALYKRLHSRCGSCKKENLKSEMIAILARRGRGQSAKQLVYLCETCFDDWCGDLEIRKIERKG